MPQPRWVCSGRMLYVLAALMLAVLTACTQSVPNRPDISLFTEADVIAAENSEAATVLDIAPTVGHVLPSSHEIASDTEVRFVERNALDPATGSLVFIQRDERRGAPWRLLLDDHATGERTLVYQGVREIESAAVTADGNTIVFTARLPGDYLQAYRLRLEPRLVERLTFTSHDVTSVSVSRDGSVVVWEGQGFSGQRSVYARVYSHDGAAFTQYRLLEPLDQVSPRVSGDGGFIALVRVRSDGQRSVLRVDLDARVYDVVYRSTLAVGSPSVTDGGEHVAFIVPSPGFHRVLVRDLVTGDLDRAVTNLHGVGHAHVTADARFLVFTLTRLGERDLLGADVFARDLSTGAQARLTSYAIPEVEHLSPFWAVATSGSALPVIGSFELVGERANPGVPVSVSWSVEGAEWVTLSGPGLIGEVEVAPEGVLEVTPATVDATFVLRASNAAGPVEASVVVSRSVPAFSFLVAGQSNAKGVNVSASEALSFITAAPRVEMLGNDYVWKVAFEPTGDCVGHVDLVSADPEGGCTTFEQNNSGVSPGVSLANRVAAATGGEVFIVPAAKHGSSVSAWQPASDRYDRSTLFGSAAFRAQRSGIDRGAPLASTFDGASYGAVVWYQGETDTTRQSLTDAYFERSDAVLGAFEQELGAPVIIVQLSARGDESAVSRNLLYQRVREVQRRMAEGARTLSGSVSSEARSGRYLVVTHDLPMSDIRHLDEIGQRELGRRISLAVREHLFGEDVDGTGPRVLAVVKASTTRVRVQLDRPVTMPSVTTSAAYSGYFAAFAGGEDVSLSEIRRDPDDASAILITLTSSVEGAVEVRYMPPPGELSVIRTDVVRAASCAEPMPDVGGCLPLPAFGTTTSTSIAGALRMMVLEDDE